MTIMPFEGLHYPTLEDEYGVLPTTDADENPVSAEDERFYCEVILTGEYDEAEAEQGTYREDYYDPDMGYCDDREADWAADRWERNFWGD